ncbi:MAG TPA: hypothetical protein QF564_31975 [Pirellulaceae bacterium]|jgi:hypothetical protein|nr:hypothetical protein [Pirellulaceae bacterium]
MIWIGEAFHPSHGGDQHARHRSGTVDAFLVAYQIDAVGQKKSAEA